MIPSFSGHVVSPVFIPSKETLHGKLYTVNGEISSVPVFSVRFPEVADRKYRPPRNISG